jgi:hypothetical protein
MEHSCDKCGHPVEDGVPFCPHCNAPQIRVAVAEAEAEAPPASAGGVFKAAAPPTGEASPGVLLGVPSRVIHWPQGIAAAAVAGLIAGLGMTFVGLLGMLVAGFLAVVFYRRRTHGGRLFARAGARLGAVSGALGFALFSLLTVPTGLFRTEMSEAWEMFRKYAVDRSNASLQAQAEHWLELLKTPQGVAEALLWVFFFSIAASAVGGALGGAFLGRNRRKGPFSS